LDAGLGVNAGHDLNRDNLAAFAQRVPGLREVSIGHALIADALEIGYADTVHAYKPGAKLIFETIATSILQLPVTK
jgi:pyridoxine 5-phosphate synthase